MKLSLHADYSFRVLLVLGARPDQRIAISEIAGFLGVSENHLVKVAHHLGKVGFIKTSRGRGGGITLARSPEEINLGSVLRKTETNLALVECFSEETNTCPLTPKCGLKNILRNALKEFLSVLDSHTLKDALEMNAKEKSGQASFESFETSIKTEIPHAPLNPPQSRSACAADRHCMKRT